MFGNSSTLATSCKELTHWKRLWCWEGLGAGGEGDDRGWDGWMASPTRWTWVWVNSRRWWWTGRPGVLQFTRSQRVGHDWVTKLNWSTKCFRNRVTDIENKLVVTKEEREAEAQIRIVNIYKLLLKIRQAIRIFCIHQGIKPITF